MTTERINKELEHALRVIEKTEGVEENRADIEKALSYEVIQALRELELIEDKILFDEKGYGKSTRIERTVFGRCYFSERRRDMWERWGPASLGIVGTLLGVTLGWFLQYWF